VAVVPKRSTERRRRNADSVPEKVQASGAVLVPPADPTWHPIATDLYEALQVSGQAQFFEPSDWAAARLLAEVTTKNLRASQFSSVLFGAIWDGWQDLLATESSRRRARIEVERLKKETEELPAGVKAIADYKQRLAK
jgi:hypothetical protein